MPTITKPEDLDVTRAETGWVEITLADAKTFNHAAMVARRWSFEPHARSPEFKHGGNEQFLYVIAGSGSAQVNGEEFQLSDEAVLWLEPGDEYHLEAGGDGLEILLAYAPGD